MSSGSSDWVNDLIQAGTLAAPFKQALVGSRSYFIIESPAAAGKPHVRRFAQWLIEEASRDAAQEGRS